MTAFTLSEFESLWRKSAEPHLGSWFSKCCGAFIYLPMSPMGVSRYYVDTMFAKDFTNLHSMLQEYNRPPL